MFGLYVHYPFCESLCPYCDFVSFAEGVSLWRERYFELLHRELEIWLRDHPQLRSRNLRSIYFGGGTPSLTAASDIAELIRSASQLFTPASDIEITLEANPHSSDISRFRDFRAAGINRLSIGIQSFSATELKTLGRLHSPDEARQSLHAAREAGFENLSADLIFGLPNQTASAFNENLRQMLEFRLEHLSVYGLTIYEDTPFHRLHAAGHLHLPEDDTQAQMFLDTRRTLIAAGYEHYEISNYALPGRRSRHNSLYWNGGQWLGIGVAAHSSFDNRRWENPPALEPWANALQAGQSPAQPEEMPIGQSAIGEMIMLGLRQSCGVSMEAIDQRFGQEARHRAESIFQPMIDEELVIQDEQTRRLSERGLLLADSIMQRFF